MSAPVTERVRTAVRGGATAIPAQRGTAGRSGVSPAGFAPAAEPTTARRSGQQKAQQADGRRDERVRRGAVERPARAGASAGRPQFVLLIMVLLAVGLVATLWLSTAAAADSYRLEDATERARVLSEQAERLHREVAVLASAPELARRAGELGMTPVQDPARLVVAPDGGVEVVGEPRAAVPPPPPAPPASPEGTQPPAPGAPEGTPGQAAPGDADPQEQAGADTGSGTDGNGTDGNGTDTDRAGREGTDGDGTEQLAAPGGRSQGTALDGAATEGAPGDAPAGAGTDRRSRAGGGTDAG